MKMKLRQTAVGRGRRTVLATIGAVGTTLMVGVGAAFGFWLTTDSSNPGAALAASLSTPTTPTATPSGNTAITVGWSLPGSQLTGAKYQVTRTSPGSPVTVCQVSAPTVSCSDTGLVPGTTYHYSTVAFLPGSLWQSSAITASTTTPKETPSISTSTSATSFTVGGSVDDKAMVSGGYSPTGTITWSVYASADTNCTGTVYFTTSTGGTVNGDSTYTSGSYTTTAAGSYQWGFSYNGDASNNSVSACGGTNESFTVNQASPTLGTSASTATIGGTVTDTATLANGYNPTGTITYTLYGPSATQSCTTQVGQVTKSVSSGNGNYTSPTIAPPQAGTYWWIANYGGDSNNAATTNGCGASGESSVVSKVTPTITTATGSSSFTVGGSVSDTASFSAGYSATGTITWQVYAQSDASCTTPLFSYSSAQTVSGNGNYSPAASVTVTAIGNYKWGFSYTGDVNNNVVSACGGTGEIFTATKASPTLGVTASSNSTAGAAITPSANLAGGYNPNGSISFTVFGPQGTAPSTCTSGGTAVGTAVSVSGNSTYSANASFTPSVAGDYWWYASFTDTDGNNNASASTCGSGMEETVVAKASPTLTVSTHPSTDTAGMGISAASLVATLAASSGTNDTSTITFTVFGPQSTAPTTCTSGGTTVGTATPAGNGTYSPSAGYTPSTAGNYWWYVSSPLNANNNATSSTCGSGMAETVVLTPGTVSSFVNTNHAGGTAGLVEQSDTITVVFGQTMNASTFCASWPASPATTQTLCGLDVTLTQSSSSVHTTINVNNSANANICGTGNSFHFGTDDLGGVKYDGNGNDTTEFTGSSVTYNPSTDTLVITLGTASGSSPQQETATKKAVYTPDPTINTSTGATVSAFTQGTAVEQF